MYSRAHHPAHIHIPSTAFSPYTSGPYTAPVGGSHPPGQPYFEIPVSIPPSPALSESSLPLPSPSPTASPSPQIGPNRHLASGASASNAVNSGHRPSSRDAINADKPIEASAGPQSLTFVLSTMEDVAEQIQREESAPKKRRLKTKDWQRDILIRVFETETTMPDPERRKEISDVVRMSPRAVQVWFQNRRAKVRAEANRSGSGIPAARSLAELPVQSIPGGDGVEAYHQASLQGGDMQISGKPVASDAAGDLLAQQQIASSIRIVEPSRMHVPLQGGISARYGPMSHSDVPSHTVPYSSPSPMYNTSEDCSTYHDPDRANLSPESHFQVTPDRTHPSPRQGLASGHYLLPMPPRRAISLDSSFHVYPLTNTSSVAPRPISSSGYSPIPHLGDTFSTFGSSNPHQLVGVAAPQMMYQNSRNASPVMVNQDYLEQSAYPQN
ncbi:uncharacterized protein SPPG_05338 [Spizellomyces punctatus DAOM BR117]|uniref:Homeobox domain-containing protein n=1 Tax=Spizellomyces punctatus (strain DAOM BR117) TaxID=645134 RepID=A0A0L0HGC8_SPIPD|nr:uncharacterized protein SPPG_05338 [Spizellomyces punctatus DAOM BR117]KNC99964.1 hypothetical protein SPPG_05338 [Spizellomyces punctatus DAOM BR117]|eukprot:XP_016608004.1 hypothetical protein SPPG_05338 [Spizellomyces punctatus DAOM BR117]